MSTAARAWETGQPALAASASFWKAASSRPGTTAVHSSSIRPMRKPLSARSRWTRAVVSTDVGGCPPRSSPADRAIEKHPAWAAPSSSSGLVPVPSSNRDANE